MRLVALLMMALVGCGTLLPGGRATTATEECRYYDDAHLAWNAVGMAAGGLAAATGSGGVVAAVAPDDPNEEWGIGLGVSGAVMGVLATVATYLSGEYATRYAEQCVDVPVVAPEPEPMGPVEPVEPVEPVVAAPVESPAEPPAEPVPPVAEPDPGVLELGGEPVPPAEPAPAPADPAPTAEPVPVNP